MDITGPAGRHHGFYRPGWAASWVLQAQVGGIMGFTGPGGRHHGFYRPRWAASWKLLALPCNNVNMPPLPSGTGKYAAHGPHYAALWLHYAALGPTALWQHNATLRQHNEALGRHIFRYPSGRGGILYHFHANSKMP